MLFIDATAWDVIQITLSSCLGMLGVCMGLMGYFASNLNMPMRLLAIFGGRAMGFQADAHTTFVRRIQTECNDALALTSSLSRTAGANSADTLGRIRSHLYAMDTINQLNVGLQGAGGYLVNNDVFTALYAVLDEYSDKLITGMQTGDLQTTLTNSLTELSNLVHQLN